MLHVTITFSLPESSTIKNFYEVHIKFFYYFLRKLPDTGKENVMDSHEHTRSPDIRSQSRKKGAGQNIKKLHKGAPLRALYQSQFLKAVKAGKESKK